MKRYLVLTLVFTAIIVASLLPTDTSAANSPISIFGLSGLVRTEWSAQPIQGAHVRARSLLFSTVAYEGITDEFGKFQFARIYSGPYYTEVTLDGYQPAMPQTAYVLPDASAYIVFILRQYTDIPTGILTGTVTTRDGTPVLTAIIRITAPNYSLRITSGTGGFFRTNLPEGYYLVRVTANYLRQRTPAYVYIIRGLTNNIEIHMSRSGISGAR